MWLTIHTIPAEYFHISYLPSTAPSTTLRDTAYSGQAKEAYLLLIQLADA